jgi:hypothetical protein
VQGCVICVKSGPCPHLLFYTQVVPTEVYGRLGGVTETHQYSVSEYSLPLPAESDGRPPAVDFMYDLSPIVVTLNMRPPSFLHYLVRMAAVVGGVFAITREWRARCAHV